MTTALNVFAQKKIVGNPDYTVRDNAEIDINQVAASRPPAPFGYKPATTIALTFGYYGGEMWVDGVLTNIADGTLALTASVVNYVEASRAGAISKNSTGFTAGQTPLYEITTDSGSITAINDRRIGNAPFTGRLPLSVAGGAGNTTLTAAQARNDIMEFTGALTGARNIIVPAVTKSFTVYNNTSGAFALTVKTAAGTGVAITQGKRAAVYCDGTNVVVASDDIAVTNIAFSTATGGTVDAITATFSPVRTSHSETIELNVECGGANTSTTPTFNPDGLGAKTIVKGGNTALVVGDIPGANFLAQLRYDASLDKYQLLNPANSVADSVMPKSFIAGGTYANNAVDVVNDLDIAATVCRDATDVKNISVAALTKQSDIAWAVGNNAGALDTGAVGNSDYYIWAILRSNTGVTDYLFSLSSTAPTMPANYNYKRLVGWFIRRSGAIVAFNIYEIAGGGLELLWKVPTIDVNIANTLNTARRTDAVKVPLNLSTVAHLNVQISDATTQGAAWICCPDQTDAAPSATLAPLANIADSNVSDTVGRHGTQQMYIRTSATGTVAARWIGAGSGPVDLYAISTMGFEWSRR